MSDMASIFGQEDDGGIASAQYNRAIAPRSEHAAGGEPHTPRNW
jgi:hypothetical protein